MDNSCGQTHLFKHPECGAARLKFLLIMALIATIAYAGYQYVPVAYQASRFKIAMQDSVDKAAALGQSTDLLRNQLRVSGNDFNVPADALMTVERSVDGRAQARVQYTRPVPLPGYTYLYKFDHTAKSTELFTAKDK